MSTHESANGKVKGEHLWAGLHMQEDGFPALFAQLSVAVTLNFETFTHDSPQGIGIRQCEQLSSTLPDFSLRFMRYVLTQRDGPYREQANTLVWFVLMRTVLSAVNTVQRKNPEIAKNVWDTLFHDLMLYAYEQSRELKSTLSEQELSSIRRKLYQKTVYRGGLAVQKLCRQNGVTHSTLSVPSAEAVLMHIEHSEKLAEIISKVLNQTQRHILFLRLMHGMSCDEIAGIIGTGNRNYRKYVHSQLQKALHTIRLELNRFYGNTDTTWAEDENYLMSLLGNLGAHTLGVPDHTRYEG